MTPEQRRRAAAALWAHEEAKSEQLQATQLVAKQMKLRPKTAMTLGADRKANYLASVPDVPEDLAAKLLVVYHLAEQQALMGAFLDALGIAHENGMIKDDAAAPDAAKMPAAAIAIAKSYPAHDVALYLNTLVSQDPGAWGALETLPAAAMGEKR
jgi:hypothetical protein